jgi:hypothetical protein
MKFETLEEFKQYLDNKGLSIKEYNIKLKNEDDIKLNESNNSIEEKLDNTYNVVNVKMSSFGNEPIIKAIISESDENIMYVKKLNIFENVCGVGEIQLSESVASMNVCESNGIARTNLTIKIDEHRYCDVPFRLEESNIEKIVLSKKWFEKNHH